MRFEDVLDPPATDEDPGAGQLCQTIDRFFDGREVPEPPVDLMVGSWAGRHALRDRYERLGWGRMMSNQDPDPYEGEVWGMDNGAWSAWTQGKGFPTDKFQERVVQAREIAKEYGPPVITVVPDKLMAGMESLEFSVRWLERCNELAPDFPWHLAVQPGMSREAVAEVLPQFDGILVGGAGEMKPAARLWKEVADDAGVRFHYPQVSTRERLFHAVRLGADSADTAMPLFRIDDMRKFLRWWMAVGNGSE